MIVVREKAPVRRAARAYVDYIEKACGIPCDLISVGPGREAIMVRRHPFDA